MENNITSINLKSGELDIPIIYSNHLDNNLLQKLDTISSRFHRGNYVTLFVMSKPGRGFVPYFGSCQYDKQLRIAIARQEALKTDLDSEGAPLIVGYAGSIPLTEKYKIKSTIFLNSRGGFTDHSNLESAIKSVVSNIDRRLFDDNSIGIVAERQEKYIVDVNTLRIFKNLPHPAI